MIRWCERTAPLEACAVVGIGGAGRALAHAALRRDDAALGELAGVHGESLVAFVGAAEALPWADGVVYLGRDPAAPALRLPTTRLPSVPLALFERAVVERVRAGAPVAVLPDGVLVSLAAARTVSRPLLARWVGATS
jgi:hypothetical protein